MKPEVLHKNLYITPHKKGIIGIKVIDLDLLHVLKYFYNTCIFQMCFDSEMTTLAVFKYFHHILLQIYRFFIIMMVDLRWPIR